MKVKGKRIVIGMALAVLLVTLPNVSAAAIIGFSQIVFERNFSLNSSTLALMTGNTTRLYITESGSIGIGSLEPNYLLQIGAGIDGRTLNVSDVLYVNGSSGKIGVGVRNATAYLDIQGATGSTASVRILTGSPPSSPLVGDIYSDGTDLFFYDGTTWQDLTRETSSAGGWTDSGGIVALTTASDFVGIGSSAPTEKLYVSGNTTVTSNIFVGGDVVAGGASGAVAFDAGWVDDGSLVRLVDSSDRVGIGTVSTNYKLDVDGNVSLNNTLYVVKDGKVGIVTEAPATSLHVASSGDTKLTIEPAGSQKAVLSFRRVTERANITYDNTIGTLTIGNTDGNIILSPNGNVGIGTTKPSHKLSIVGSGTEHLLNITDGTTPAFIIDSSSRLGMGATPKGEHRLLITPSSYGGTGVAVNISDGGIGIGAGHSYLHIDSSTPAATVHAFRVVTPGDTEIDIRTDGSILSDIAASTPADVAEWTRVVGVPEDYEPGDLVMFSTIEERRVEKAVSSHTDLLMGVVTLNPGLVGVSYDIGTDVTEAVGERSYLELEALYNAKMVTTIGYTPVKVSTENGALGPGDPIAASSIPGIGKKAAPGEKIIGYSFESFNPDAGQMGTNGIELPMPTPNMTFAPTARRTSLPDGEEVWQGWVLSYVNLGYANAFTKEQAASLRLTVGQALARIEELKSELAALKNQQLQSLS